MSSFSDQTSENKQTTSTIPNNEFPSAMEMGVGSPDAFKLALLPNEMLAEIVKKLDLKSCLAFGKVSSKHRKLVNRFARFHVEITVTFMAVGYIQIVVKDGAGDKLMSVEVNSIHENEHAINILDADQNMLTICWREQWTMKEACFGTLGRIMQDPIFNTTRLVLNMGSYDGEFNLGMKSIKVGVLAINRCENKRFVESIFYNYDIDCQTIECDSETIEKIGCNPASIMQESVDNFWKYIHATEESYSCAFPEEYKVKSNKDGLDRIRSFHHLADIPGFPTYDSDEEEPATSERTNLGLMLLRAGFSEDPVDYLRLSYPHYHKQVNFLREGIDRYKVDNTTLAIMSSIFVLASCRHEKNMPKIVYPALRTQIDVKLQCKQVRAFEKFLEKVEQLADRNREL